VAELRGREGETSLEADLAAWGRVIILETRGRRSGRPRSVAVGFVETADGSLLVAATDADTHWARNLQSDPRCVIERDGQRSGYRAIRLDETEQHAAAAALILKYGTPAERLGGGPAFRLVREVAGSAG
jgi:deazaflavin-dependent oxidoreductase (nitroreductase family)